MANRRDPGDPRRLRPNELSIDLVPNKLSVLEGARPGRSATPTRGRVAKPSSFGQRRSGRRVGLSGLLTAGLFVAILVSRLLGAAGAGDAPSQGPAGVAEPGAPMRAAPGHVVFGLVRASECRVGSQANSFGTGDAIWYTARFTSPRDAGEQARLRILRGEAVQSETIAPDRSPTSSWDVLCGGPFTFQASGTYRVEVRDIDDGNLLASGVFTVG